MGSRKKISSINALGHALPPQSSTLYIYYIYIELASAQSPFFQNLPYECTACVPDINKKRPVLAPTFKRAP